MRNAVIAIFASGSGTNAKRIIEYFKENKKISIGLVCSNNGQAGVLRIAEKFHIDSLVFSREDLYHSTEVIEQLQEQGITHIVLAGFLWLIPSDLIRAFNNRIINIHPALLPNYGGKGMYGMKVHEAVKAAGEKETGITIHLVNEKYDEGRLLLQKSVELAGNETPIEISKKVQILEHHFFPLMIERWITEDYLGVV